MTTDSRLSRLHSAGLAEANRIELGVAHLRADIDAGRLVQKQQRVAMPDGSAPSRSAVYYPDPVHYALAVAAGVPMDAKGCVCYPTPGTYPSLKKLKALLGLDASNAGKGKRLVLKLGDSRTTDRNILRRLHFGERISLTPDERATLNDGALDAAEWLQPEPFPACPEATAGEVAYLDIVRRNCFRWGAAERDAFHLYTSQALSLHRDMRCRDFATLPCDEFNYRWMASADAERAEVGDSESDKPAWTLPQPQRDSDQLALPVVKPLRPAGAAYNRPAITCHNPAGLELHADWMSSAFELGDGRAWLKAEGACYGQREVATAIMSGSAVIQLPTGFGKSFPLMSVINAERGNGATSVIVLPTNALKQEWRDNFRREYPEVLVNLLSHEEKNDNATRIAGLVTGQFDVLLVSPEHLMPNHACSIALLQLGLAGKLARIVFDEAHLLWDWRGFRPANQYAWSFVAEPAFDYVDRVLMSATLTAAQRVALGGLLTMPANATHFQADVRRENITLQTQQQLPDDHRALCQLLKRLAQQGRKALVFCDRIKTMARMRATLACISPDTPVELYHSGDGMTPDRKAGIRDWFETTPNAVLLATTALSVGVNLEGADAVIVTYIPDSLNELVQLIGRAGRNGLGANAILLYTCAELAARRTTHPEIARLYVPDLTSADIWQRIATVYSQDAA